MKLISLALAGLGLVSAKQAKMHTEFAGQKVVQIIPQNEGEMEQILTLGERGGVEREGDFDIWDSHGVGDPTDIRVTPEQRRELEDIFGADRVKVTIDDLEGLLDRVQQKDTKAKGAKWAVNEYHEDYHTIEEVMEFIYQLESDYSELVTVSKIGESYEGRDLLMACLSTSGCDGSKPAFFLDGGVHAREWIAHATMLYLFENLLIEQRSKADDLLERMDFYIVPHMNPDGYEYSRVSRMWRKSRMPTYNPSCVGTDLNRNWEYEWGGVGASTNPCSDTYRGGAPIDNPEVAAVQAAALNVTNALVYIDTHSYGNYFLTPWGYTYSRPDADDYADHIACAKAGADALYAVNSGRYGGRYTYGQSSSTLYATSGSAPDTVYSKAMGSAKYSITIELPGRDGFSNYGFLLPPEAIIDVAKETMAGIKAIAEYALEHP